MPEVSVIICAYNAASTLPRCLNSIVKQTFGDFEIILVDDCSTDETLAIANRYAAQDCRIRIFHNEKNRGISYSRQRAMDNATGRYTIHADADDHIDPAMLQSLHEAAIKTGADVVICDYFEDRQRETSYITQRPTSTEPRQIIIDLLTGRLHGSCCNKLIARHLYTDNHITFPQGVNCCEDLFVCLGIFKSRPKVYYLPQAFYHYIRNNSSITTSVTNSKTLAQDLKLYDIVTKLFADSDTMLQEYARKGIAKIVVLRSFHSRLFTSSQFRHTYKHFAHDVADCRFSHRPVNMFFYMACTGSYHTALLLNDIYVWMLKIKHKLLKCIKSQ